MSTSYGFIIEFSRNEKSGRESLSHDTNYLTKWLLHFLFHTKFTVAMFIFSSVRFLNMCTSQKQAGLHRFGFYGGGLAYLQSWLGMVNADWLGSIRSEIFLQMKYIIFQGCPVKQAVYLPGQPAPYNQLLNRPLLLEPECYFA